jgi:hypothetical protein
MFIVIWRYALRALFMQVITLTKNAHETTKIACKISERILNKLFTLCMIFCSYMCTRWLQGFEPKTVQPVALAIPTTLSRLNFEEIRSRYISGGSNTMGTSQISVHIKCFVNYGIFRMERDSKQTKNKLKKVTHRQPHWVVIRLSECHFVSNIPPTQGRIWCECLMDTEWLDNLRSFAVSKTLHFPHHHEQLC